MIIKRLFTPTALFLIYLTNTDLKNKIWEAHDCWMDVIKLGNIRCIWQYGGFQWPNMPPRKLSSLELGFCAAQE